MNNKYTYFTSKELEVMKKSLAIAKEYVNNAIDMQVIVEILESITEYENEIKSYDIPF